MYKLVIACIFLSILLLNSLLVSAAPARDRPVRSAAQPLEEQVRDRPVRSVAQPQQGEAILSLVLNPEEQMLQADGVPDLSVPNHRTKRHAAHSADIPIRTDNEEHVSPTLRRRRRSAAWWLSATISLCNKYHSLCRRIDVAEGDVQLTVRLLDQ